jgi:hypothetical protein
MPVIALIGKLLDLIQSAGSVAAIGQPVQRPVPIRVRPGDRRRR